MVSTRERMIETAARLFQRDGYHATSWRGLVEEAGTPWGSIHHHFPGGKEELGVAAIDAGAAAVAALIRHSFETDPRPAVAVALWFRLSADLLVLSDYSAGCPVATVALETASTLPAMRQATHRAFELWQAELTNRLRAAGVSARPAREAAETVLVLLEGGLLLARIEQARRPIENAARQAEAVVRSALGGPTGT